MIWNFLKPCLFGVDSNLIYIFLVFLQFDIKSQTPCQSAVDLTIPDGAEFDDYPPSAFIDKTLSIEGTFVINTDAIISNSTFIMGSSNAKITVQSNRKVEIFNSYFGCNEWIGLEFEPGCLIVIEDSEFDLFSKAISINQPVGFVVTNNKFGSIIEEVGIGIEIINSSNPFLVEPLFYGLQILQNNTFVKCTTGVNMLSSILTSCEQKKFNFCVTGIKMINSTLNLSTCIFNRCNIGIDAANSFLTCYGGGNPAITNFDHCTEAGINSISCFIHFSQCKFTNTTFGMQGGFNEINIVDNNYFFNNGNVFSSFILDIESKIYAGFNIVENRSNDGYGIIAGGPNTTLEHNEFINPSEETRTSPEGFVYLTNENIKIFNNNNFNCGVQIIYARNCSIFDNIFDHNSLKAKCSHTWSEGTVYCDNEFLNLYNIEFGNFAFMTSVGENTFAQSTGGIILNEFARIGYQDRTGNIWNETSTAKNPGQDPSSFNVNINPPLGDPHFQPAIGNLIPSTNWFLYDERDLAGCDWTKVDLNKFTTEDSEIILGTYAGSLIEKWYQRLITFEKFLIDSTMFPESPELDLFINECLGTDIEFVAKTSKLIQESKHHPIYSAMLSEIFTQKVNTLAEISFLNNLILEEFSSNNASLLNLKYAELELINQNIINLINSNNEYEYSKLAEADLINNSISGENDFTFYEKYVNALMIQKYLNKSMNLSITDYANVKYIANLCPTIYGKSVIKSRTFLSHVDKIESIGSECLFPPSNLLILNSRLNELELYNNITSNTLYFRGSNSNFNYKVVDIEGNINSEGHMVDDKVNVDFLLPGMYTIMLHNNVDFKSFIFFKN